MTPVPSSTRHHSLDALRAAALLLGVFLHAALAYVPGPGFGWAVQDRSTHVSFGVLVLVVHSFRLEVFFLLAGFFGRLLHQRLGPEGFVINRLQRIFVPFGAGWLLVFPLLAFSWIWGSAQGELSEILPALVGGYGFALGQIAGLFGVGGWRAGFPLTHLWFLYYLLLVYALVLGGRILLVRATERADRWRTRADAAVRFLFGNWRGLPVLVIATWFPLLGMPRWEVATPDKTFVPHPPALALYVFVFTLGWLLHRQAELLTPLRRRWGGLLAVAVVLTLVVLSLAGLQHSAPTAARRAGYLLCYAGMMWAWIFASLGLFLRFAAAENRWWRYLADSSYWVYIIHLPLVTALQVALSRTALPCGAKFALVAGAATVLSLASYHLLVRSTPVGQLLNGRRHPRRAASG
jgi:peptidoglycan/LPS O-acetylase OafA/YrhL